VNYNEKTALLAKVGKIMTNAAEPVVDDAIVDYFQTIERDSYEFLLAQNTPKEEILAAAIARIQEETGSSSGVVMSSDAYATSSETGTGIINSEALQPPADVSAAGKAKSTTTKKDITAHLAGTLPSASRNELSGLMTSRWGNILNASSSTKVGAYCVDTPVRENLTGKTFAVTSEEYVKAFKEKYTLANVVDDSELGAPGADGKQPVMREGDNIKAFKEIMRKLDSRSMFDVRVPDLQNQKVIGILFNVGEGDEVIKPMKDVPLYVLTELGGKVPGQPGIEVTGITSTSRAKTKNGTVDVEEIQAIAVKHKGKVDAMKSADSKYIVYTAAPLSSDIAQRELGAPQKEYSVSSVDSFRYKGNDGKVHVVRVRGKINVPFFKRKDEYSVFGSIAASNRVEELTDADRDRVLKLFAAACRSPQLKYDVANALGLSSLVNEVDNVTPQFNAASVS